jgi:hypothetical protein
MSEDDSDSGAAAGPSPSTRAFIARRAAMDEASAAAAAAETQRQQGHATHRQTDYQNPVALLGGLAVLALLLLGFIFVLDRLRGDPWYADCPTGQASCR